MQITVNNQLMVVDSSITVNQLLTILERSSQGIAVAINNKVVFKSKWEETNLEENDEVLIIQATCGG